MCIKRLRGIAKSHLSQQQIEALKTLYFGLKRAQSILMYPYARFIKNPICLLANRSRKERKLEIGPGQTRIPGFETVNVIWTPYTDYIGNASKKLPFASNTFDVVYGSHVLEHIPWYQLNHALREWFRILKPGGTLEIWVPNGLLIAEAFVNAERGIANEIHLDGWYKFNPGKDPCIWANGRIFSYGDGDGDKRSPNWHLSLFSPRFLRAALEEASFVDIEQMPRSMVRGYDHGWINLGIKGKKP